MRWIAESICLVSGDCHLGPWHAMFCLSAYLKEFQWAANLFFLAHPKPF